MNSIIMDSIIGGIINRAVVRSMETNAVPIANNQVHQAAPVVTSAVVNAINNSDDAAVVQVKSAWTSKINWTALIMFLLGLLTYFGIPIDDEAKLKITEGLLVIGPILVVILKTWFTNSITSASKPTKV